MSLLLALGAFGVGAWLLVESVEGLVKTLASWAAASGLSTFVLAALVLGLDLESTAAGVAASLAGLPGTALGASIGSALFLVTIGLGLAALTAPFSVRTPRSLLIAAGIASVLSLVLLLDGILSRADGAVLLAAFAPLAAVVARSRGDDPPARGGEGARRLALRLLAGLAGLVVGAELLVFGTERIVGELGLSETVFGLLVVAAAVSFEEVILEMLPAHRGHPEISVGNALGTLLFLLTGSLGIIALVEPIAVPDTVRAYHAPALGLAVVLLGAVLLRGRLGRPEGGVLVGAYAAYVAGALVVG